jgi:hypothetical protein
MTEQMLPGPCGEPKSTDPDDRFWISLGRKIAKGASVRIPDGHDRNRRR